VGRRGEERRDRGDGKREEKNRLLKSYFIMSTSLKR
jgi:hypothetical protein